MFDPKSDYALNKRDPDAIVCRSAAGEHIRLTREDFDSDEEFLRWKRWSDREYQDSEKAGRSYYDNCIPLFDALGFSSPSAEDVFLAPILETERVKCRADLLEQIKAKLTEKQYRRLWMYYLEGMTEAEIAKREGVGQRRVSTSISRGREVVKKFLHIFLSNRG